MGLDQYLSIRKCKNNRDDKVIYPKNIEKMCKTCWKRITYTEEYEIGYWRKSNAIHRWFVENCSTDGEDDCQPMYVTVEKIKELRTACMKVLADHSLAPELLPTEDGFFFGSTDYGDWYYEDASYTLELLDGVINFYKETGGKDKEDGSYYEVYYTANW